MLLLLVRAFESVALCRSRYNFLQLRGRVSGHNHSFLHPFRGTDENSEEFYNIIDVTQV